MKENPGHLCEPDSFCADVFWNDGTWSARIYARPLGGGSHQLVWSKDGMRTEHNAGTAMEAAWQRLTKPLPSPPAAEEVNDGR